MCVIPLYGRKMLQIDEKTLGYSKIPRWRWSIKLQTCARHLLYIFEILWKLENYKLFIHYSLKVHSPFVCDQDIWFQQRTPVEYTQLPSAKATEGAALDSECDIGREKIHSGLSTTEGTAWAACSQTSPVHNSSAVLPLPEWECSSVSHFLTAPS